MATKKTILGLGFAMLFAAFPLATFLPGEATIPTLYGGKNAAPYESREFTAEFDAKQTNKVIVIGYSSQKGGFDTGFLGLYVYDSDGNCVAMDDVSDYQTRRNLAVEYYSPQNSNYSIEVANLSNEGAQYDVAISK